jgi:TrmH family RNA methyltransferase
MKHNPPIYTKKSIPDSRFTKQNIKELTHLHKKKYRSEEKKLLIEGKRLLNQIHKNGIGIKELFCLESDKELFEYLQPESITYGEAWELEKLAQTKTSQQVIGLIDAQKLPVIKTDFLLYLDNISEPGNLGTIFRTALGLGVDGIITSPGCCELFNPKAIRASMGAVLTLPSEEHDYEWLFEQKGKVMVTCLENSQPINSLKNE